MYLSVYDRKNRLTPKVWIHLEVFNLLLVIWASNNYLADLLCQLKISYIWWLNMICCDLQTELDGISMIVMALLILAAVRVLRKGGGTP